MEFEPEKLEDFLRLFEGHRPSVLALAGCHSLTLCKDPEHPYVRYSLSQWASIEALEAYRNSPLFRKVWPKAKAGFSAKPQAFTLCPVEAE